MHTILFLLIYFHIIVICVKITTEHYYYFNMGTNSPTNPNWPRLSLIDVETVSSNEKTIFIVDIIHNYIYSSMEGNYLWIKKVIFRENTYFMSLQNMCKIRFSYIIVKRGSSHHR